MNVWDLPENIADGVEIHAPAWNRLLKSTPAQINGALQVLGVGVVQGWEVTPALQVLAGAGIAYSAATGFVALESTSAQTVAITAENPFVHASIVVASGVGAPDSRETRVVQFMVSDSDELDGALLLAELVNGAVIDRRVFIGLAAVKVRITALESAVGAPYDAVTLGTIKNRLQVLEGGGTGESASVLWGALQKSGGDNSTIDQAIAAAIAANAATAPDTITPTGIVPLPPLARDEIAVNMLENRYLHLVNNDDIDTIAPMFRGFVISLGRGNWLDIVDLEHTTVNLDIVNHTIG